MPRAGLLLFLLALAVALSLPGTQARAEPQEITLGRDQSLNFGRQLLAQGRPDVALAMARALVAVDPQDPEALVLLAAALQQQGDYPESRQHARTAYATASNDMLRFEAAMLSGRADFHHGAHTRAQWWLRRAAHNAPDAETREIAERNFLQVRRANPLELHFNLGVTGSSNVNDGSSSETIEIFGLPFRLDGTARALSGTEIGVDMGLRYRLRASRQSATFALAALSTRNYRLSSKAREIAPDARNRDFARQTIEVGLAHRFALSEDGAVYEITGRLGRTWYGGDLLSNSARLQLSRSTMITPQTNLRLTLSTQRQNRLDSAARSSTSYGLQADVAHAFDSGARLFAAASWRETQAQATNVQNTAHRAQVTYVMAEPVMGVRLSSTLDIEQRRFPENILQPDGRRDLTGRIGLSASLEVVEYMGFSPSLNLQFSRTRSNVSLYESESLDMFLGVNSRF